MDTWGLGQYLIMDHQHLIMDHQLKRRRGEARARLSLEDQAARGLLGDRPMWIQPEWPWGQLKLWKACSAAASRAWRIAWG